MEMVEIIGIGKFKEIVEVLDMKYLLEFKSILVDEILKRHTEMRSE